MDLVILAVVVAASVGILPIVYVLNLVPVLKHQQIIAGTVLCLSLAASAILPAYVLRRRYRHVDFAVYVFAFLLWSSFMNLLTSLQLDGIFNFVDFNFLELRPMLNNTHGVFAGYWDASVHYVLQLSAIIFFCWHENYRQIGLYWCGSFINFMLVLLGGTVLGENGKGWQDFINLAFLVLAVSVATSFLRERPFQPHLYRKVPSIIYRPLDLFFTVYFLLAIGMALFRGFAVLGANISCLETYLEKFEPYLKDMSAFPKVQMLVNMFYFVFYYLCAIDGLLHPGQVWMPDWALIHAGAAAQSQFVHIASSIHSRTPGELRAPQSGVAGAVFWGVNLAPLVTAHFFALRYWQDPDRYGLTSTKNFTYQISKASSRQNFISPRKRN